MIHVGVGMEGVQGWKGRRACAGLGDVDVGSSPLYYYILPFIERLRVRIPAGAAGEFSSPESTLCADSYSVSVPPSVLPQ